MSATKVNAEQQARYEQALPRVRQAVLEIYAERKIDVPFHGWHHARFVAEKARLFAKELGANVSLVETSALVHDLNYLVNVRSGAKSGRELRNEVLLNCGLLAIDIEIIESIVLDAEIVSRGEVLSAEAMALSDGDTLFKALPITPVVLAPLFLKETGVTLAELARKIVGEQVPLKDEGIYFYSPTARGSYQKWADANLLLWTFILDSIEDPAVRELLRELGV